MKIVSRTRVKIPKRNYSPISRREFDKIAKKVRAMQTRISDLENRPLWRGDGPLA